MRIALIADIHSNLIALEAVLAAIKKHRPERIISLGDQVNLGPSPKETLALLHAQGVTCLHGNHERYILSVMDGDPAYDGANFASLRFNAGLLKREEITFPKSMQIEGATLCHAMPEDDRFPMYDGEKALPLLRQMTFNTRTHIICGHGHNPTHISMPNFTLDSIGSVGCMDDGVPGTAPFAIATIEKDSIFLRPFSAAYDVRRVKPLFQAGGMSDFCPVMAHIACLQMMTNTDYLVPFVRQASALSRERGETRISMRTWQDTDAAFPWPDGVGTAAFWR